MSFNLWIFGLCSLLIGALAVLSSAELRLPGDNQGYEPVQPIAFSHRLHAGEMKMDCQYCHYGARSSRHAGVPPASICMSCHRVVSAGLDAVLEERARAAEQGSDPQRVISPELDKLYQALALDEQLEPIPGAEPRPIEWVRVHNLPDFVYFDHRVHVARDIACETCHGPVQTMERMRQASPLSMGWCLECHRSSPAAADQPVSTNCVTCHL